MVVTLCQCCYSVNDPIIVSLAATPVNHTDTFQEDRFFFFLIRFPGESTTNQTLGHAPPTPIRVGSTLGHTQESET